MEIKISTLLFLCVITFGPPDISPEKAMIKHVTGTDEAAGRHCLSGLQVLIKQLTGDDQLADRC